ncbi:MAG: hypothetical protein LBS01_02390 [Prevotellaceae bacterium]|jgi:hypothetical protein|nr:hypothetical protein [Prevotellaceae bacterium]
MGYKTPGIKTFREVCNKTSGILSAIARAFNVERGTVYDWCAADPQYQKAVEAGREAFLDIAESQLVNFVKGKPRLDENGKFVEWEIAPSERSVMYALSTIGKRRGFTERSEVELGGNVELKGHISIESWLQQNIKKT